MAVEEEKLERFEQAIFSEVEAKSAEILGEVDAYKAERLEKVADEELEKSYQLIQSRIDDFRASFARKVTQEKFSSKQRLLRSRQELTDKLFVKAGEKLKEFAATPAYEGWLQRALNQHPEELRDGVVLVRDEDRPIFEKLIPGAALQTDLQNHLGGFGILNQGMSKFVDETFAAHLEAEKEKFYQNGSLGLDIADPS